MQRFSAHYIYPISSPPLKNGIVEVDDEGYITQIISNEEGKEYPLVQFFSGIITPGFVNCHTHLELSYLKGKIPQKKGLANFVQGIISNREDDKNHANAMEQAMEEMYNKGVVAIGDICNTVQTVDIKKKWANKITSYSFCEAFGRNPEMVRGNYDNMDRVKEQYINHNLQASIVPHSPYSVHPSLLEIIISNANPKDVLSIHNQESESENEIFLTQEGDLYNFFTQKLRHDGSWYQKTGKNSLSSIWETIKDQKGNTLLVHNTYISEKDIKMIAQQKNFFMCLCPKSNLYIEGKLPPLEKIAQYIDDGNIVLGTDSLASNSHLSILEEMKTLPQISLEKKLHWATLSGAKALNLETQLGSIETGKKPGLNLITSIDWKNKNFTTSSNIRRLV